MTLSLVNLSWVNCSDMPCAKSEDKAFLICAFRATARRRSQTPGNPCPDCPLSPFWYAFLPYSAAAHRFDCRTSLRTLTNQNRSDLDLMLLDIDTNMQFSVSRFSCSFVTHLYCLCSFLLLWLTLTAVPLSWGRVPTLPIPARFDLHSASAECMPVQLRSVLYFGARRVRILGSV
jgi:hypothetical protein